jgi:hypothetical protein
MFKPYQAVDAGEQDRPLEMLHHAMRVAMTGRKGGVSRYPARPDERPMLRPDNRPGYRPDHPATASDALAIRLLKEAASSCWWAAAYWAGASDLACG